METHLNNYLQTQNFNPTMELSKVSVEVEIQSKINSEKIYFTHNELFLNQCESIFAYHFENKKDFSLSECAKKTKVDFYIVKSIFDKYIK